MKSIKERLLANETVTLEWKMNEFSWNIFKPSVGDQFVNEGCNIVVVESTYYKESELGIIRVKLLNTY